MADEITNKEEAPVLEDALAKAMKRFDNVEAELTDETEASATEEVKEENKADDEMSWPLPVYPLVAKFDVQKVDLEDQQAVVLAVYTGAGATFGLLSREGALALSQRLKKVANTVIG